MSRVVKTLLLPFGWVFMPKVFARQHRPAHRSIQAWKHWIVFRHAAGIFVGVGICFAGSYIAVTGNGYVAIDMVGYMLHGVGCMPIYAHIEPFMRGVFVPVAAEVAEVA